MEKNGQELFEWAIEPDWEELEDDDHGAWYDNFDPPPEEEPELCDACLKMAVEHVARVIGRTEERFVGLWPEHLRLSALHDFVREHPCIHQTQEDAY